MLPLPARSGMEIGRLPQEPTIAGKMQLNIGHVMLLQ